MDDAVGGAVETVVVDRPRLVPLEMPGDPGRPGAGPVQRPLKERPSPLMYITIFVVWMASLAWFGPRLLGLLDAGDNWVSTALLGYFVVFVAVAWLYGIYNLVVVGFALIYGRRPNTWRHHPAIRYPEVAVLYTTRNDFAEPSALSCVELDYPDFQVYMLDDSDDPNSCAQIDEFAARHGDRVVVVRREDRRGFKAGNLNHALANVVTEPYFVIADSDEVLPPDFLTKLVPRMEGDPMLGFIQANHRCPDDTGNALQDDLRHGVDIHWRWYQPLRNRFGFVMFLGHGAILRRRCWVEAGGFPEIVSEDLAYAIELRELGYRGAFASDVVCLESFPEDVRSFRVRHVKWTRGTCEFLRAYFGKLVKSRRVSTTEKLDILFPTINLPLTVFFFGFVVVTSFILPFVAGQSRTLTAELGFTSLTVPTTSLPTAFNSIYTLDFFLITVITISSPVLCFILSMWRTPVRLLKFLAHSTALYATLAPLTVVAVAGYAVTGKATFFVTGDRGPASGVQVSGLRQRLSRFAQRTHPDSLVVRGVEIAVGVALLGAAVVTLNLALAGVAIGYVLIAWMHSAGWKASRIHGLSWAPGTAILVSVILGSVSLIGVAPSLLGGMFHF